MLRTAFDGDSGTRTRTSGATSEAAFYYYIPCRKVCAPTLWYRLRRPFLLAEQLLPLLLRRTGEDDGDRTRKFQLERLVTLPICLRPQIWR